MLAHEMMHGVLGYHPDFIVNSNVYSGGDRARNLMRFYSDRVVSCEVFCFGTAPTSCACAACHQTKVCDDLCSGYASCRENDANGDPIMSEAVGAACVDADPQTGEETASFHADMATCAASGCTGTCRSMSLSCDPGCQ